MTLTRWVFPYIFLVSLVALASGILNSLRHFAAPAAAPIFLNLSIIAAAVVLSPRLSVPIYGLAYGVLIGGVVQLAVQIPPLVRHGVRIVPRWQPGHEAVRRALGLMAPMVFGAAVYQINLMISTMLASVLPSGSVSYLWYADRIFEFPLGIFAVALGTAALPSFSAQAARRAYADLRHSLAFSIRITNAIVAAGDGRHDRAGHAHRFRAVPARRVRRGGSRAHHAGAIRLRCRAVAGIHGPLGRAGVLCPWRTRAPR